VKREEETPDGVFDLRRKEMETPFTKGVTIERSTAGLFNEGATMKVCR